MKESANIVQILAIFKFLLGIQSVEIYGFYRTKK